MLRTLIGGLIGFGLGVLLLAGWGIYDGLSIGLPTAKLPPGIEAAVKNAFVYSVFFWPWALVLGGGGGAICGFGSWLVRPHLRVPIN
jgi:hypothetical protein